MYSIQVDGLPSAIREELRSRRESISTCNENPQQLPYPPSTPTTNFGFVTQDNSRCSSACENRAIELSYREMYHLNL